MNDMLIFVAGAVIGLVVLLPYVNRHREEIAKGRREILGIGDVPIANCDRPVEGRTRWWLPFAAFAAFAALAAIGGTALATGVILGDWPLLVAGTVTLISAGTSSLVARRGRTGD